MKSSWSLTDTLNTDFDRGSLFDDLPEASNKMQQFTESKSSDKGAINKSLELSSVPSDQREQLEQMGSYTPSSEENKTASNPLDFVAPEKAAPQAPQEDDWTLGKYFSVAREGLQKLDSIEKQNNFGNATQRGVNKARFEAYKSQLMEELSDHIENKFGVPRAEVGGLFLGLSKDGSGYRSREEIDQIADIRKNGVAILDDTGNPRHFNAQSWDQAMELQKIQRSREIEIGLKKSAAGDPVKTAQESMNLVKSFLDADGKPLPGKEAIVESLYNKVDTDLGVPTGVSLYSDQFSRLQNKEARMNNAMVAGVGYGDIPKENLPQEIVRLREQSVSLAADKAPYFDSQEGLKTWFADPATRNLPAFVKINEARVLVKKNGDDPNILDLWSPTEKNWGVVDFNKKEAPPEGAKATPNPSSSNEAGKKLNKLTAPVADLTSRYTPQELFEKAGDRVIDAGLNIGDYFATGVRNNVLAPALEFSAGVAGKELDLEALPNPSFKARKWKSLTPKERAALLGRSSPGLTIMEAGLKAK